MPPVRDHNLENDDVDDSELPPLVDQPKTFTFLADMTPFSFNNPSSSLEQKITSHVPHPEHLDTSSSLVASVPASPITPDETAYSSSTTRNHGKRRDASYIPRPPNAFILFRSSFIRSQQVPGKVEGNHSTLSKIIGMYWKSLPREEREQWEAKAVIAQAEHRKRYPYWRFRPEANATAKLKIKDGGSSSKRRIQSTERFEELDDETETVDRKKAKEKGKAKAKGKKKEAMSAAETRCAKIADFLVEGKKGPDLEDAVNEWESCRTAEKFKTIRTRLPMIDTSSSLSSTSTVALGSATTPHIIDTVPLSPRLTALSADGHGSQSSILPSSPSTRSKHSKSDISKIPLTHMFRRSLSAPASDANLQAESRESDEQVGTPSGTHSQLHGNVQGFEKQPPPSFGSDKYYTTWQAEEDRRRFESSQQDYWWTSSVSDGRKPDSASLSRTHSNAEEYSPNHVERYPLDYPPAPQSDDTLSGWTAEHDLQDSATVIEDPYVDPKAKLDPSLSTSLSDPLPASAPPLLIPSILDSSSTSIHISDTFYYPPTPTSVPSSSFSTLSGWAGAFGTSGSTETTSTKTAPIVSPSWGQHEWNQEPVRHRDLHFVSEDWDRSDTEPTEPLIQPVGGKTIYEEARRRQHHTPAKASLSVLDDDNVAKRPPLH